MLIKFRYEERDIANALRLQMTRSLRRRPEVLIALFVCVGACVVSYAVAPGFARVVVVAVAAAVVLIASSVLFVVPRMMFRRSERFRVPITVDASDEGLTVVMGVHAETIAWRDCERVDGDRRIFVIHHGNDVVLVPRRAFRNADREKAFFDLLGQASREKRRLDSGKSTPMPNQ